MARPSRLPSVGSLGRGLFQPGTVVLWLIIWRYSASVGQVLVSRQERSMPWPRCRLHSSATRGKVEGRSVSGWWHVETTRPRQTRTRVHLDHGRVLQLQELLQREKVDKVGAVDRQRNAVDLVRHCVTRPASLPLSARTRPRRLGMGAGAHLECRAAAWSRLGCRRFCVVTPPSGPLAGCPSQPWSL